MSGDVTPEMTAWVEQQERAGARYDIGGSSFPWGVGQTGVSLRHLRREYAQAYRRALAAARAAMVPMMEHSAASFAWDSYPQQPIGRIILKVRGELRCLLCPARFTVYEGHTAAQIADTAADHLRARHPGDRTSPAWEFNGGS